ncbi:MAG: hypothetical protein WBQ19_08445 [Terriglobales bacterium]|jgi:hypothetical protein
MGDLTTNRSWDNEPKDCPSQYARMIPGTPAMPHPRVPPRTSAPTAEAAPPRPIDAIDEISTRRTPARTPMQQLLPQPTGDRFMLFQLVAADLIVLGAVCGAASLLSPAWGLPWACLPILRFW